MWLVGVEIQKMPWFAFVPHGGATASALETWYRDRVGGRMGSDFFACREHQSDPLPLLDTRTLFQGDTVLEIRSIDAFGNLRSSLTDAAGRTLQSIGALGNVADMDDRYGRSVPAMFGW